MSMSFQIKIVEHTTKFTKIDSLPITFTEEDARRVIHLIKYPFMVVLRIAND